MPLALALALGTLAVGTTAPSSAAPAYEIDGDWINAPATISRGNPVVAEWRVNINDDQPAPSNDPVEDVTATFTVQNAFFEDIPDMCRTTGVTPVSSISDDGTILTCNFGTVNMGTAILVQTPVVANGVTNEDIVLEGTSPSGEDVGLPPIPIRNPFAMDMQWGGTTDYVAWDDVNNPTYVDVDFEWSLRLGNGSDPGPNSITQRLTLTDSNGRPLVRGTHPDIGDPDNQGVEGCTEFDLSQADGHPWSHRPGQHPWSTQFVDSCTLAPVPGMPGVFDLTLTGINYDLLNVPELDSWGNPLPTNWDYVASGMVWFRVLTNVSGSLSLQANAPTYTAPTGQVSADLPGNNASSKVYTLPGGFSSAYIRWVTGSGGTPWDDTYRVAAGTTVSTVTTNWLTSNDSPAPGAQYGVCQAIDTTYMDFDASTPIRYFYHDSDREGVEFAAGDRPGVLEYYTGGVGDPNSFNCGTGTWSTTLPADPTTVTAVRWSYPASAVDAVDAIGFQFWVPLTVQDDVAPGQDVWMFGSYQRNGIWTTPTEYAPLTPTPDYRYANTTYRRDVLVVVTANPVIRKSSPRSTVTPGVPAQFTLTYAATGSGNIPDAVDGYRIVDTLPLGMTYVDESADPEPTLSTDAQGRQVLTWVLDDVTTNQQHPLVYEAVADESIAPGTQLTNTAVSSLGQEDSVPASKTVTTSTNGYTDIGKTADTPYISNVDGSGDGEGSWTVTMRSFDPLPQAYTDIIDILPYRGDFRGTHYEGSYQLSEVTFPAGSTGTVYYATAHPATLSDDPAAPTNGGANTPSTIWSTTFTPDATAVRVIGGELSPGDVRQFRVHITTDGAQPLDRFVNRAQGRAQHTRLVTRTSAPMQMAPHYAANLKKYVQDARGVWRDANDVTDYPAFKLGDTVKYRIVVTNIGQGTLTDIDVTDDKFPQGSFHVDSLAPGQQQAHEYSTVVPGDATGTLVNTACAEAATPADAGGLEPVINCDLAGREIVNYVTKKASDPVAGTAVQPGQKISYTVSVTQQGTVPAEAVFTDDLADVLDDANYNGDVTASIGTVQYVDGKLVWSGTVPVGQVAYVTYSVTVKGVKKLGNRVLVNPVTSPGCVVQDGQTVECDTAHPVPEFDLAVRKDVIGSKTVLVGNKVSYRLRVSNKGPDEALAPITLTDALPKGLQLRSAKGTGWECQVRRSTDVVTCTYGGNLAAGTKAPPVIVVAKATKPGTGRLVNVAKVSAAGDTVRSNNRNPAAVEVKGLPALPSTGFRARIGGLY